MKRHIIGILIVLLIVTGVSGCSQKSEIRYEASFLTLFDTVTSIVGFAEDKEQFTAYAQMIHDNLLEYHQLYDRYNDYEGINNIKTINDHAGIEPVKVDHRIIEMLSFAKEKYDVTDGKVNVAMGAVLEVWHEYRTAGIEDPVNAQLPPMELLEEKAMHTDIDKLIINEEESTVYLEDPEMSLDVGAIAKGYATEQVAQIATEQGFTSGMISVGGNVRTIGVKVDTKQAWNIAVQNPDLESEQENLYILKLSNTATLVTSGDYQRYYTVDGKQYHHIIDPNTLMPAQYYAAVSILCYDSGVADALSTAVYNMPYDQGHALIESLPDTEALWVYEDGKVQMSSHFGDYIKE